MRRQCFALCAVCLLLVATTPVGATVWTWNDIPIDGLQEVPPVATPGSGIGMATLDDVTGLMTISGTFQDLIGTSNNAHLHGPGATGVPAGVIFGLLFDVGTSGTFSGSDTLTATEMEWVIQGLTYINIHSTFWPNGEIRGQLWAVPEPTTLAMAGFGLLGAVALGRRARR